MKSRQYKKTAPTEKNSQKMQELIRHISYYFQTQEKLKGLIINVKSAKYNFALNTLKIGYTTIDGKYGTVKEKLIKSARELSDYMFELNLYKFPPKIEYVVQKEDPNILKVQAILDSLEKIDNDNN
jgi:copper chaperone CopZ